MSWLLDPQLWLSFLTLTILEVVLGIDNLIFISILSGKLPADQQSRARRLGLGLAVVTRVLLLLSLSWVMHLDKPFWSGEILGLNIEPSGKDIVLVVGGLFLIYKSTREIHEKFEPKGAAASSSRVIPNFSQVVFQILLLDIVFSLDSVITAIGMANQVGVMIAAVVAALLVMIQSADAISGMVERHPTIKMLALAFLILIGTMLVAQGFHQPISKGYIYFAMAFSAGVETLNIRLRGRHSVDADGAVPPPPAP
jgi:predicted tellurium resistance membrane protein TerC